MNSMGTLALAVLGLVAYVLLSGVAYVSVYRWPDSAPTALYSWLFAPLDVLARRFKWFAATYNAFHQWCYRRFVRREEEA